MKEKEIWRPVVGYEGIYEVSNLGRVKSLKLDKEKILKPIKNQHGYLFVNLYKNKKQKIKKIHQLVSEAFLNHTPCGHKLVVDHINDIKTDNRVENLQIVTNRFNVCKTQGKYSSRFKGVCWDKANKKWRAGIHIKGKKINLGRFENEIDASNAYQEKLKELEL